MYKKEMKEKEKDGKTSTPQTTVNPDKLKKGMAALFLSGEFNTDDLAEALSSALNRIE